MKNDALWERACRAMRSLELSEGLQHLGSKVHSSEYQQTSICVHAPQICGFGGEYIAYRQRTTDTLERKLAKGFDGDGVFDHHQNGRANQNLTRLGFVTS
jgi:hypothetical protein